jgi:prefoldin subunit 5
VRVVFDGARTDEQPGADFRVGVPVAGQPGDLGVLRGRLQGGLDGRLTAQHECPALALSDSLDQPVTDRFLPDKAIDLVDEACARLRTEIDSLPAELDAITRRVTRLEIEEVSLAKESDPASKARLEELRRELADLRAEADARHAQWDAERQAIKRVEELRGQLEQLRHEAEGLVTDALYVAGFHYAGDHVHGDRFAFDATVLVGSNTAWR